jgi:hypothetical protein
VKLGNMTGDWPKVATKRRKLAVLCHFPPHLCPLAAGSACKTTLRWGQENNLWGGGGVRRVF